MPDPIVYGPEGSPYVWIVRLALTEKGVAHKIVHVGYGAHQEPPHLERHPFAKVPAFDHDGFSLYETQAIIRYVDEEFDGPDLQPVSPRARARMNQVIGIMDSYGAPCIAGGVLFNRMLKPMLGMECDEGAVEAALPRCELVLRELSRLMGEGPWFAADMLTLADLMAVPFLFYLSGQKEGRDMLGQQTGLNRWLATMKERPSFAATLPDIVKKGVASSSE